MQRSLLNNNIRKVLFLCLCSILYGTASSQHINWQKLPFRLNWYPGFFYFDSLSDKLIIGGNFWKVNSTTTDLFMWDGSNVSFFKGSLIPDLPFTALRLNGKDLYLGGAYGLYRYNDTDWIKIDTNGNRNDVESLYQFNNQLLIGGVFGYSQFPNKQYAPISKLENNNWIPLYGIDTVLSRDPMEISKILLYKNDTYAGGQIDQAGPIKEGGRWNGT